VQGMPKDIKNPDPFYGTAGAILICFTPYTFRSVFVLSGPFEAHNPVP
jgi:hypothetical protein